MGESTAWTDTHCPVARTLDIVGDKWSLLIVRDAFDGARRFTQFQRNLGIAKNILTDRLRMLVENGILESVPNAKGTRAEYELTEQGCDLFTVVVGLRQWGERHAFGAGESHSILTDSAGRQIPRLRVMSAAGVDVEGFDAHVVR
nr:helix-turn-helix domain-containing protein [Rhodococcus yunnanensis]